MAATTRWILMLVLSGAVGTAGVGYWMVGQSHEMLRQQILKQLHAWRPEARWSIASARIDWSGRVRLGRCAVVLPGEKRVAARLADVVVTIDRALFAQQQQVVVKSVELVRPEIRATQEADGTWNWQKLGPLEFSSSPATPWPDISVDGGRLLVQPWVEPTDEKVEFHIHELRTRLRPTSAHRLLGELSATVDPLGAVAFRKVDFDLDTLTWNVAGKWQNISLDEKLWPLVQRLAPQIEPRLLALTTDLETRVPAARGAVASLLTQFRAKVNLEGEARSAAGGRPEQWNVVASVEDGTWQTPWLSTPIYDMKAAVVATRDEIQISELAARWADALVKVAGSYVPPTREQQWHVTALNTKLTDEIRQQLPQAARRICEELALEGLFDAELVATKLGESPWSSHWTVTGRKCSFAHMRFPYRVQNVSGVATCRDQKFELTARGLAGESPTRIHVDAYPLGPKAESNILVEVEDGVIDRALLSASPAGLRKTLLELDAKGQADVLVRLKRPPGLGQKFVLEVGVGLKQGSMRYRGFPFPIENSTATILYTPAGCKITQARGRHGDAVITATGEFRMAETPNHLWLDLKAEQIPLDQDLYRALPPHLQAIWQELSPTGRLKSHVDVNWSVGQSPEVWVKDLQVEQGTLKLAAFPYRMEDVAARLDFQGETLRLHELTAARGNTRFAIGPSEGEFPPGQPWSLNLRQLQIDDLLVDQEFRRALPETIRSLCETLNPIGPFSATGKLLKFQGDTSRNQPTQTSWDFDVVLPNIHLTAGAEFKHVNGGVKVFGACSDSDCEVWGRFDLDSAMVFEHQVTRVQGPFEYANGRITVGTSEKLDPPPPGQRPRVTTGERITANFVNGQISADVVARFEDRVGYDLIVELVDGRLEEYAQRYMRGRQNLRGSTNGWMRLRGNDFTVDGITGSGKLRISEAAMYELPIIVQIFSALTLDADRSAFDQADLVFSVGRKRFRFSQIDLIGPAISLRGQGVVLFDGLLQLDFYSTLPTNQVRLPLLKQVMGALGSGWLGVEVRGAIGAPIARVIPVPELNDSLRQLLVPFDPRTYRGPPPRPNSPRAMQPVEPPVRQ